MTDLMDRPFLYQEPADDQPDETDRGLVYDLDTLDRRRMLQLLGFGGISAGMFVDRRLHAGRRRVDAAAATPRRRVPLRAPCAVIPEETAGPFPGDGSNGPNVLAQSGVVRSDIRSSFGSSTTVAEGVPLTIELTIQDAAGLRPARRRGRLPLALRPRRQLLALLAGGRERELPARRPGGRRQRRRDVHDDLPGLLLGPLAARPLRGLSEPRRRDRRAQQDRDLADRAAQGRLRRRSTRPPATSRACTNLSQVSLPTDMVFRDDGAVHQLGTMSGSVADGLPSPWSCPSAPSSGLSGTATASAAPPRDRIRPISSLGRHHHRRRRPRR